MEAILQDGPLHLGRIIELWPIIVGLVLREVLAAPFAAYLARSLPDGPLMILVGVMIIVLSLRGLIQAYGR